MIYRDCRSYLWIVTIQLGLKDVILTIDFKIAIKILQIILVITCKVNEVLLNRVLALWGIIVLLYIAQFKLVFCCNINLAGLG